MVERRKYYCRGIEDDSAGPLSLAEKRVLRRNAIERGPEIDKGVVCGSNSSRMQSVGSLAFGLK
jgi:hypothetical protein